MLRATRWIGPIGIAAIVLVAGASTVGAQVYPPIGRCGLELSVSAASPGEPFTITGTQGEPGVTVDLFFESTPVLIATATTDAMGRFSVGAVVPADATDGVHRVRADGVETCGASITIDTKDRPPRFVTDDPTGNPPSGTRSVGPGLAFTGANTIGLLLFALVVLTVGIALFAGERRNSSVRAAHRARRRAARAPASR